MIPSENISALTQNSFCRCLKHASPVTDMEGNVAESYVYDPAGNILSKTIDGKTTTFTYDDANQLVSSTCDGKITHYAYDAAGRLIKEGDKSYAYGWLDKVLAVRENGKKIASFDYQVDGQIAQSIHGGKVENFLWDNLALIHRGETSFINEPYVTGGNPILSSKQGVMFNDILGTTLGTKQEKYSSVSMTAFGETKDTDALFTGKPYIGELGYAFLFRNYRADKGKWLSADPLGYPDGWNNFAYVNNQIIFSFDIEGGYSITLCVDRGSSGNSYLSFGHAWVRISDDNDNTITRGFYPKNPGPGALTNDPYVGYIKDDSGRTPTATITFHNITQEQYNRALALANEWAETPPNWSLSNNCVDFSLAVLRQAGINPDVSSWTTATFYDPKKVVIWIRNQNE